ncbi:MAG: hypothetical protein FJZ16_06975 [Candidatus Omnitrophica bacterium]|nr:hypothetical protein [Candidatus Omnitrophota bacterium]
MSLKYETLAKFVSKRGGDVYYVKRNLDTGEITCNCKGCLPTEARSAQAGIYRRWCKHVDHVTLNPYIELTDIPTYQEALVMDWGKNLEEKEKWLVNHLKPIEL